MKPNLPHVGIMAIVMMVDAGGGEEMLYEIFLYETPSRLSKEPILHASSRENAACHRDASPSRVFSAPLKQRRD